MNNMYIILICGYVLGTIITLMAWPVNNPITYLFQKIKKDFSKYVELSILHRRFIKIFLPLSDTNINKLSDNTWILVFNVEDDIIVLASEKLILAFKDLNEANDFIKKLNVTIPVRAIKIDEVRIKKIKLKFDHL